MRQSTLSEDSSQVEDETGSQKRKYKAAFQFTTDIALAKKRTTGKHVKVHCGTGPRCVLCCYKCSSGSAHLWRLGRSTCFNCFQCGVALCTRVKNGQLLSCFDVWHSDNQLHLFHHDGEYMHALPQNHQTTTPAE